MYIAIANTIMGVANIMLILVSTVRTIIFSSVNSMLSQINVILNLLCTTHRQQYNIAINVLIHQYLICSINIINVHIKLLCIAMHPCYTHIYTYSYG